MFEIQNSDIKKNEISAVSCDIGVFCIHKAITGSQEVDEQARK